MFSRNLTKTLTSIYRDVVLKICTNRDNRQINLVHFVVNSDEWENIKRCKLFWFLTPCFCWTSFLPVMAACHFRPQNTLIPLLMAGIVNMVSYNKLSWKQWGRNWNALNENFLVRIVSVPGCTYISAVTFWAPAALVTLQVNIALFSRRRT